MGLETAGIIALTSAIASAGSGAASFAQANKQKKRQRAAEEAARKATHAAKKKLDVNYMKDVNIAKEAFEIERKRQLTMGTQAIDAGVQSERGASATAGKVIAMQNEAAQVTTAQHEKALVDRQAAIAAEESRLAGLKAEIDLGEAEGAQLAAENAERARAEAAQQGFSSVTSAVSQGVEAFVPLFEKKKK